MDFLQKSNPKPSVMFKKTSQKNEPIFSFFRDLSDWRNFIRDKNRLTVTFHIMHIKPDMKPVKGLERGDDNFSPKFG